MDTVAVAAQIGPGCLAAYMRLHQGRQLALPWPADWSLVIGSLENDPEYEPQDIKRWNGYLCCEVTWRFLGRVGCMSIMGLVGETLPILISNEGRVFCYGGKTDDAIYYVAEDMIEFSHIGLHHIERLHRPLYLKMPYVKQMFQPLRRSWNMGFDAVARFVIRNHGKRLPLSYPHSAELRLCNLRCFEASAFSGTMMRLARAFFGLRLIGIGTVDIQQPTCRREPSYYDWPKRVVPVFMVDDGRLFACDAGQAEYVRLADDITSFMCLGLTRYYANRRFGCRQVGCHDRVPDCPKDCEHVVSA
ncbi:tegument protein UL24 [Saimiriine betaherpesvirus 4]|uniref:Tegument protein UL24 n=1 Tax=Saimiriine betaherpesvirus 4 TaxID=1535247 RepID=G8XST8_9BETA|nr:tegument protein UL24 [Saimiriine betaherpesvirus 4]AEV80885.1 tegument protein UL24 [Saimiriine betaherpesvirus 4]